MGWSKGKGLGANMDGEQNFVRISHKADQKGIGYADRDDQWTCHANSFNSLLKSLDDGPADSDAEHSDKDNDDDVGAFSGFGFGSPNKKKKPKKSTGIKANLSGKSLEEMSKSSGVRVHYKKFTRGKDTSRYSEKDLANIFGKKVPNDEDEIEQIEQSADKMENENDDLSYGITTVETGTTINDYFKKKKTKKSKKAVQENFIDSTQNEPETISDAAKAIADDSEIIDVDFLAEERKRKKKDKKRKRREAINDEEPIEIADSPKAMESIEIKKKKKKKKNKEKKEEQTVDANEIVTLDDSNDSYELIVEKPPKCKKRKKNEKEVTSTDHQPIENSQFFKSILETIMTVNHSGDSSTELKQSTEAAAQSIPALAETYELNRYQAEMFRFVDLNGFPNANISELSGYGFKKNIDLKITAKSQDHSRINDLWDYALINKYGKDVIRTKKKQRYSIKTLKKKSLFKAL